MCFACLASCGERRGSEAKPTADLQRIVATVNGSPLTDDDLQHLSKRVAASAGPHHEVSANVLQTLVRDELIYQKAIELGLDAEPGYREKLGEIEAQLRAFKRQEMSLRFRTYVQEHAAVTDADARKYYEDNAATIKTRFHVQQIFYKGNFTEIVKDHDDLKNGRPFDEVAGRRFPVLPAGVKAPWDLGELRWHQLPLAWRGIVDRMEPGQFSDVIKGENERFWVIELAGKTADPAVTFDTEKEMIVEALRQQKADELYASTLAELNRKAKIVYAK